MKKVAHDPHLSENVDVVTDALAKANQERAKQAGAEAPKLWGAFWEGMKQTREEEKAKKKAEKEAEKAKKKQAESMKND